MVVFTGYLDLLLIKTDNMNTEQMAFRMYPHGWTGNSIKDLNSLLRDGWHVKFIINEDIPKYEGIHTLILERVKQDG